MASEGVNVEGTGGRLMRFLSLIAAVCVLTPLAWADDVIPAANEAIARHDTVEAIRLLTPAADAGDANAQALLGSILLRGTPDVPRDEHRAASWMQRAANQGFAQAQLNLGGMFKQGYGFRVTQCKRTSG
jgi:TPR repeat protein